jgi:type I restriction-modification system DNA methylase subunit
MGRETFDGPRDPEKFAQFREAMDGLSHEQRREVMGSIFEELIRRFSDLSKKAVEGDASVDAIVGLPVRNRLAKSKYEETIDQELDAISKEMEGQFENLGGKV